MTETRLDTKGFVGKFGTEKQKESFKKNKYLMKNVRESLINKAEAEYESVKIVKEGRSNVYVLSNKRDEKLVVKDGRHNNGAYSITYTKDIDLIVLSLLLDKSVETDISQTMRKWLLDFGLISQELFDLVGSTHDTKKRVLAIEALMNENILNNKGEATVLSDYIGYTKELQGQLESSLNRMRKANIINFYPVFWAKLITEKDGKAIDKRVRVTEKCVAVINEHKRMLMDKYNVSNFDVNNLRNKKEVKAFNEAYKYYLENDVHDEGEHISIDYFYKAHAIHIKATNLRIEQYLNKKNPKSYELLQNSQIKFFDSHRENYKDGRLKRVVELAEKKVDYIENNKLKVEGVPDYKDLFGKDALLDAVSVEFTRDYYNLFLDNNYIDLIEKIEVYYSI